MAALYLHHALFASNTAPSPSAVQAYHNRSVYSVPQPATPRTASEYSQPNEPLLRHEGVNIESTASLGLLARQRGHHSEPRDSWNASTNLQLDPVTPAERKRLRERIMRRNLRRLDRGKWTCLGIITSWAAYNSIRYFVAFSLYPAGDRRTAAIILGTSSTLTLALTVASVSLHFLDLQLGWKRQKPLYTLIWTVVNYASPVFLIAPAATNVALTCLWKRNNDPTLAVEGRCHWDIDVVWSGSALGCESSMAISWRSWIAGALVRLVITLLVLALYHLLDHKYNSLTSRLARRNAVRAHSHSVSYSAGSERSLSVRSGHSSRTMISSATLPVSLARSGRQLSQSASDMESILEVTERRSLHHIPSARTSAERSLINDRGESRFSRNSYSSSEEPAALGTISNGYNLLGSVQDALSGDNDDGPYAGFGRQVRHNPGVHAIDLVHPPLEHRLGPTAQPTASDPADDDLHNFVDRFRVLLEQVTRETDAGLTLSESDVPGSYTDSVLLSPSQVSQTASDEIDYVPIVGSLIRRMPTIESIGSREIMSLATSSLYLGDKSIHSLSQPPTRANTLSPTEATASQPPSRSNSLTASVALASPIDAPSPASSLASYTRR